MGGIGMQHDLMSTILLGTDRAGITKRNLPDFQTNYFEDSFGCCLVLISVLLLLMVTRYA